jgi:phosphate transport system protein
MPKRFDEDLAKLKQQLLDMGALAERMINKAIRMLVQRDAALIAQIKQDEDRMDQYERDIDTETVRLISVFTPVAGDLRVLLMVTRINAMLERVGDQTVNICHGCEDLIKQAPLKPLVDLPRMARIAEDMVHLALEAFTRGSAETAATVIKSDDEVDQLYDQIFRELLTYMLSDPRNITPALGLILAARAFERIGDHAVNIAEDVVYIVQGQDIRHLPKS